jgi:GTP-binding protein
VRFIDETVIEVRSGRGGDGIVAFRRERNLPHGGPDGGDGGDGGSVYVRASEHLDTLLPLARTQSYRAGNGEPGQGNNRTGRSAEDVVVDVPIGTVVHVVRPDAEEAAPPAPPEGTRFPVDLDAAGKCILVARGGRGGYGNRHYASATNQSPREFTYGEAGEARRLRLELKLIADVGLVGFPNAGKSTLLARLSAARPKVADYPFTTLQPQLGIVSDGHGRELVLADIPGLIEGAADGAGLGHEFLRHIERCRVLLHLVNLVPLDGTVPWDNVRAIRAELAAFSPKLAATPELLVGNKLDLTGAEDGRLLCEEELGEPLLAVSAVSGEGLRALVDALFRLLAAHPREAGADEGEKTEKTEEDAAPRGGPDHGAAGGGEAGSCATRTAERTEERAASGGPPAEGR